MSAIVGPRSERIELACFAALAALASLQWASLVADPPTARVAVAVLLATAAGGALAAIGRIGSRRARWALGAAAAAVALLLGMVLVGLPARMLLPDRWDDLAGELGRSLDGIAAVPVPYDGADAWTRLALLLTAPLVLAIAAWAAFWPSRRRTAGRLCALVLLVTLYLVAIAWETPGGQLAEGALLCVLVCAWLWLPGLRTGSRSAAVVAVGAAGLLALPVAAAIDPGRALIDYRRWNLLNASAIGFEWDQSYGPLDWPQRGSRVLNIASDAAHYWKAVNLDSFDGTSWVRSAPPVSEPALGQPLAFHSKGTQPKPIPDFVDRVNFEVRGLSSPVAVGAGTVLALDDVAATPTRDGVWETEDSLERGDSYTALVYDPKPSDADMARAGTAYPAEASPYVSFSLAGAPGGPRALQVPFWGRSGPAPIEGQVRGTPYETMYALARSLAEGAATPSAAVRRIEFHLRANYEYEQDVPARDHPLPDFLSVDRAGYCQQFSGTMALMLRMLGIPSRVASGFATGVTNVRGGFQVEDTDAHNWVEVFFPEIGWVTFDPTPAAAPAATPVDQESIRVTQLRQAVDSVAARNLPETSGGDVPAPTPAAASPAEAGGPDDSGVRPAPLVGGAVAGAAALIALAAYGYRRRRRSRLRPDELVAAELGELERALERLGEPLPPGATLLRAEDRLERLGGVRARSYAATLREWRYRRPQGTPPRESERRALRGALLKAARWRSALRVLLAIPPGGPKPR
ncbi:MAG TPA: transglutaminase-like domain-containing protein [Solirubrobacterales bacterium]